MIFSNLLVGLVAFLETYFLVVEMFLWTTPRVLRMFGMTPEFAAQSAALAKNQGLYNGFLAAGLVWGMLSQDAMLGFEVKVFFLACVLIAGIYGSLTANRRILFVQALPALIALIALMFARGF